jgi:L-fuculose-phosphate aldolase
MIALFGAPEIKCAKYAPTGGKDLADLTLEALGSGHAALIGNFGALTTGGTIEAAVARVFELETLARLYAFTLMVGKPRVLADEEVFRIMERLKGAGGDIESLTTVSALEPIEAKAKPKRALGRPAKGKRAVSKRGKG